MEIIKRNALGIGISSFILLISKLVDHTNIISNEEIWYAFYVAIITSNLSFLDHIERLSYWQITFFHFLGTYVMLALGSFYFFSLKLTDFFNFSKNIVIVYIIIWSSFVLKNYFIAKYFDQKLKK